MESSITVRPPASPEEELTYFEMATIAFARRPELEGEELRQEALRWQQSTLGAPGFHPEQLRGAFRDGVQMGGYTMNTRVMRMGAARIPTGCIGAVVTHTSHRKQGVASALLRDAADFARSHNFPLLLLDGIPHFYHRFGYTRVFDLSMQDIERAAVLAIPAPAGYSVRPATGDDAAPLLALYEWQYGAYTGSFERSIEAQRYVLQGRRSERLAVLAPDGKIVGYGMRFVDSEPGEMIEVAAENWEALLTLLQYHARRLEEQAEAPTHLRYRLPPDSPLLYWLVDNLKASDVSQWEPPTAHGSVVSQTFHYRNAGWMASLVSARGLLEAILPELQARRRLGRTDWSGDIALIIGAERCVLRFKDDDLQFLVEAEGTQAESVTLTPQTFTKLAFGYRPVSWALSESQQRFPSRAERALANIFPTGHTWIPGSDWF